MLPVTVMARDDQALWQASRRPLPSDKAAHLAESNNSNTKYSPRPKLTAGGILSSCLEDDKEFYIFRSFRCDN